MGSYSMASFKVSHCALCIVFVYFQSNPCHDSSFQMTILTIQKSSTHTFENRTSCAFSLLVTMEYATPKPLDEDDEVLTEHESDVTLQADRYAYSELKEAQRRCGEKAVAAALQACGAASTAQRKVRACVRLTRCV